MQLTIIASALLFFTPLLARAAELGTARTDEQSEAGKEYVRRALEFPGDAAAGEQLFRENKKLVCTNCHRITGVEKSGPNLEGIADKYPRPELIQHVLRPNAAIKPGYEQATVVTRDGRTVSGRIIRATKLIYRLVDARGKSIDVDRDEIEQLQQSTVSMMPDNLTSAVSPEEFADLIAYLETLHFRAAAGLRGADQPVEIPQLAPAAKLVPIHSGEEKFANPVWCGFLPGLSGQLAVVEHQEARIWRLEPAADGFRKRLFVDLGGQVKVGANWGLMCLAFHPRFAENGRYFLEHEIEQDGIVRTTVLERRATADLLHDSGAASRTLLALEQPAFNHNGGCIAFGNDGMLYIAFGDGGPQRDPPGHSQNPRIFHGSMLRIDVDRQDAGRPYAIPPDNPLVDAHRQDAAIRPETWAIGFREPWRFSFDSLNGDLWVGDVGQDEYEEVCLVRRGENHGWNVYEAYQPFSDEYRRAGESYAAPLFAYHHRLGASVTGGYVYRGRLAPSFAGVYVFGDYETRRLWGIRQDAGRLVAIRELGQCPEHIASFGVDDRGEILAVGYEGTIFHVDLSATSFE